MAQGAYPYPKFLCINLPERKDRLQQVKEAFKGWNIEMDVVPAVKDTLGWKGCFASHLKCIEKARAENMPWVVIIEDDCKPTDQTKDRFDKVLAALWKIRNKWEIFNGGPTSIIREETSALQKGDPPLFYTKGQGGHFYVVHNTIYDKILKNGKENITKCDKENCIIDLYYRRSLKMVCTYPNIAIQIPSTSNIEKTHVDYSNLFNDTNSTLKQILDTSQMKGGMSRKKIKTFKWRIQKKKQRYQSYRRMRKQKGGESSSLFVRPDGGLGNQLYIYGTGLALSKLTGKQMCLLPAKLNHHSSKNYRDFMEGFQIEETGDIQKRYTNAPLVVPKPDTFYKSFSKDAIRMERGDMKLETEYYQNFTPIIPFISEIRTKLFEKEFKKDNYKKYDSTINPDTSAFMHVRRGDYTKNKWLDDESYYINALTKMKEFSHIKNVYVLSDDIGWCRDQEEKWKSVTPGLTIECKDIPDELEALYFMILCKGGGILSTSSFSAWGAILGPDQAQTSVILYPKKHSFHKKVIPTNSSSINIHGYPSDWLAI